MHTPEQLFEKAQQGPFESEKLLELINVVDQKTDEIQGVLDAQGTDIIKLVVYVEALESLLLSQYLVTKEQLTAALLESSEKIRATMLAPETATVVASAVDDIKL